MSAVDEAASPSPIAMAWTREASAGLGRRSASVRAAFKGGRLYFGARVMVHSRKLTNYRGSHVGHNHGHKATVVLGGVTKG
eukprot:scaffold1221_cov107-Isochrysis_galbana.AAC.6